MIQVDLYPAHILSYGRCKNKQKNKGGYWPWRSSSIQYRVITSKLHLLLLGKFQGTLTLYMQNKLSLSILSPIHGLFDYLHSKQENRKPNIGKANIQERESEMEQSQHNTLQRKIVYFVQCLLPQSVAWYNALYANIWGVMISSVYNLIYPDCIIQSSCYHGVEHTTHYTLHTTH